MIEIQESCYYNSFFFLSGVIIGILIHKKYNDLKNSSKIYNNNIVDNEVKNNEVKKVKEVKNKEVKDNEVKDNEVKDNEVEDNEIKDNEVKDNEVEDNEIKDDNNNITTKNEENKIIIECPPALKNILYKKMIKNKNLNQLVELLFSNSTNFFLNFYTKLSYSNIIIQEQWQACGDYMKKENSFMMPIPTLYKSTKAKEIQYYKIKNDYLHLIHIETFTKDISYGDYFSSNIQILIKKADSDADSVEIEISGEIKFFKDTMMKGLIESGGIKGMTQTWSINFDSYFSQFLIDA